jgi:hypothetical protein
VVVPPVPPPPTDLCPNIDGNQENLPDGYYVDGNGNCVTRPPVAVAECVFLTATPSAIAPGQAVTLAWQTKNATSISIDNGVGSVSPVANGSTVVHPTQTTTYVATVTGTSGSVNCQTTVTVTTVPPAQCVFLTGTPASIKPGESATLAWKTLNATSISIDNGIGLVTPTGEGSRVVTPTVTTTYIATVTGATGSVNCQTTITVTDIPPPPAQCVFLTATPNMINAGDAVNLSWKTLYAGTVTIDNGVGQVAAEGSTTVHPTQNTTYVLTATGPNNTTVNCQASVTITPVVLPPMCVSLKADRATIKSGDAVTLSWVTNNATSVTINNGVGTVTPTDSGSIVVNPTSDTTYTANVSGESATNPLCQVSVQIESTGCTSNCGGGGGGGGGGRRSARVGLESFVPDLEEPLAFVYLSEVPYTGLELGTWGTALYWVMLIGWSLALAYLVLFNAVPFALARARSFGGSVKEALNSDVPSHGGHDAHAVAPSYVSHAPSGHGQAVAASAHAAPAKPSGYNVHDGFRSFAAGEGLTIDDIVKGLSREIEQKHETHAAPVVAPTHQEVMQAVYEAPTPAPEYVPAPVAAPVYQAPKPVAAMAPMNADVRDFVAALLNGDRDTVFGMIRSMARQGQDTEAFVSHAACALDDAYRACIDGTTCHPDIAELTNGCHPSYLERLVSSLTTAVDGSYSAGMTGVKMALTRALGVVAG